MLFNIDTDSPTIDILENQQSSDELNNLLSMVDCGQINQAENELYEIINIDDLSTLKAAILFYSYLNEKSDEFLESNNYERSEIESGLKDILYKFGLSDIADLFLYNF